MGKKNKRKRIETGIDYDGERNCYYCNFSLGSGTNLTRWSETFATLQQAQVARMEFLAKKKAGKIKSIIKKDTLEEHLNYWVNTVKGRSCSPSTLYGYKNIINKHIIPKMGHIKIQKLNASHVNKYLNHLKEEKGLGNNTIKKHYALLKDAMDCAKKEKKVFENVIEDVTPVKFIKKEIEILTEQETKDLLEKVNGHSLEIPVYLATLMGLRRGEINGLLWSDVNLVKDVISITKSRTQIGSRVVVGPTKNITSNRTLAIPAPLKKILEEEKIKQEENKKLFGEAWGVGKNADSTNNTGYVFCKPNGTLYRPNYPSNYFPKFLKRNNLKSVNFHSLRHTCASIALQEDGNMFKVSKMLGHSNITTTMQIYAKLYDNTNADTINKISNALV